MEEDETYATDRSPLDSTNRHIYLCRRRMLKQTPRVEDLDRMEPSKAKGCLGDFASPFLVE